MNENFEQSFNLVIKSEGGFTNDQRDTGNHLPDGRQGSTMLGCTQANWEAYVGHQVTQDDMKKLTKEDVKPLYKKNYWDAVHGDDLPTGLDYAAFDFAINAGPAASRKMIQRALGVEADGAFGPITMAMIQKADAKDLMHKFSEAKTNFYKSLSNFNVYGTGWLRRVADVQTVADKMIG
jgi:lysozyme family protein